MSFDIAILFFLLGFVLVLFKVEFEFPAGLGKTLMLILLLAIGLKGGMALKDHLSFELIYQSIIVLSIGFITPLFAFPVLRYFGNLNRMDAASLSAHYGSVSIGTFAVAVAFLEAQEIPYEAYFVLFLVLLEVPAIFIGLMLATKNKHTMSAKQLNEILLNPGIVLIVGAFLIGMLADRSIEKVLPLFQGLFGGVLALFLLDMGMVAAKQINNIKDNRAFLLSFGVFMPLVAGTFGSLIGHYLLHLSPGGVMLLATLAASSSYIAVPAAMRIALPNSNHGLSIAASLGVTFPFNVIVGIPLYWLLANALSNSF